MAIKSYKKGQALLIVMLAMATISTVVLSIVSRSISQVEVTDREEESLRAFSAAEAGLEQALVTGLSNIEELKVPVGVTDESTISNFTAEIVNYPEDPTVYDYPFEMVSGESATVWFASKDVNGNLLDCGSGANQGPCFEDDKIEICWGLPVAGPKPALELTFVYESGGDIHTATVPFDPEGSRISLNNFKPISGGSCVAEGKTYLFSQEIYFPTFPDSAIPNFPILNIKDKIKLVKVKMLYNTEPQTFAIKAVTGAFPAQGKKVTSVGQSGNATRKIEAYLIEPSRQGIFDSAMFSSVDLVKNN